MFTLDNLKGIPQKVKKVKFVQFLGFSCYKLEFYESVTEGEKHGSK